MNEDIPKLIYDLRYQDALELIMQELEQEEVEVTLDFLSYACVCAYIVKGVCLEQLDVLTAFVKSEGFDSNKVKKNTKTLIWLFDTINEHVHDNKLTLSEPLDHVLSNLLAFKEALPASININVQLNKLKSYLMSAKKDKESKETQKTEDALEEEPKESISVGFKGSTKLLQLFKKIELCMELSNQNRQSLRAMEC
ncbi:hypothetical protein ACR9PT_01790 [Piscirickettsia salmonis]|uniref:hypothetical protein n=1 Tax=Piscirickettsia salmonis TaxID=1238 RepID=UPI003EBAF55E